MQPKSDNSTPEPLPRLRSTKQRTARYVAVAMGLLWTGYFLNEARWRLSQWLYVDALIGPFLPIEWEKTYDAIRARLDWRRPLFLASLPLLIFIIFRIVIFFRARYYRRRQALNSN